MFRVVEELMEHSFAFPCREIWWRYKQRTIVTETRGDLAPKNPRCGRNGLFMFARSCGMACWRQNRRTQTRNLTNYSTGDRPIACSQTHPDIWKGSSLGSPSRTQLRPPGWQPGRSSSCQYQGVHAREHCFRTTLCQLKDKRQREGCG